MEDKSNNILKDRIFKVKFLNLPKLIQLNVSMEQDIAGMLSESSFKEINKQNLDSNIKPTFILDYARFEDFQICLEFLKEAANVGDNVGEDEFENDDLLQILNISEVFVIKSSGNQTDSIGNILVFIILQPYWARAVDTCQTMVSIYYGQNWFNTSTVWSKNENFKKEILYATLTSLAVKLAEDIQIGYTDALVKVCPKTHPYTSIMLKMIGFQVVTCIPNGISINGKLEEDFLMMKSFAPSRLPRTLDEMNKAMEQWHVRTGELNIFNETPLLSVPFLPLKFKSNSGNVINVRSALKSDVSLMFDLYTEAAAESEGYTLSEYPTITAFKTSVLKSYNMILEFCDDKSNNETVGYFIVQPSRMVRTKKSRAAESSIVIGKQFRGQKIGRDVLLFEIYFARKMGFKMLVNDFLETNIKLRRAIDWQSDNAGMLTVGILPRSAYIPKFGWIDIVVRYIDLENTKIINRIMENFRNKLVDISSKL